jgi:hypothetical protein
MFQQKNGMLLMWASRTPMDQLKEVLVALRGVQGVQGELKSEELFSVRW